jgi:hypothetical protein
VAAGYRVLHDLPGILGIDSASEFMDFDNETQPASCSAHFKATEQINRQKGRARKKAVERKAEE